MGTPQIRKNLENVILLPHTFFFKTWAFGLLYCAQLASSWVAEGNSTDSRLAQTSRHHRREEHMADIQQQLSTLLGTRVKQLRTTEESPPNISVIDVVAALTGLSSSNAAVAFMRPWGQDNAIFVS